MTKTEAIHLFETPTKLAKALGITRQAVYQWPDELPQATSDRVIGAASRYGIVTDPARDDVGEAVA